MAKKIFFHTKYGDGLALVPQFQTEGYEVIVHIAEPFFRGLYEGFCDKDSDINHWTNAITKNDLVVFDAVGSGNLGDKLRAKGIPVYGGQLIADQLENDRMFGLKIMQQCGVKVPYTVKFTNRKEGINFIKNHKERYIYKPFGFGQASAKTFVSKDSAEMLSFLTSQTKDEPYILQCFVEGNEYSTEMFFSKGEPVEPSFHTIEDKKAYAGETGPATGCMNTVQIADKDLNNEPIKQGLGKCFEYLKKVKYTGNIDLNSIIDKNGDLWGIEWTARDGWSSSYARNAMLDEPVSMLYSWIANGDATKVELKKGVFGLSIRVAIPPYPLESTKENEKYFNPLIKLSANKKIVVKKRDNVIYNFLDVKSGKDNLLTAGCDGIILEVTTTDKDIIKGRERLIEAIDGISLEDKWYRCDSFDRALEQIPLIQKLGFYDGPEFKGREKE